MLRFDKFTAGNYWISEYGCATCGRDQFAWLYKYSPYANVRPNTVYPPTLIITSDHDDRVFPAHSFKFAARMQADQAATAPISPRVQLKAGHGESATLSESINLTADVYAFLVKNLGMALPKGFGNEGHPRAQIRCRSSPTESVGMLFPSCYASRHVPILFRLRGARFAKVRRAVCYAQR